jgi:hypothetical protein
MLKIVVATSLAALVTGFSTVPKTPMGDEMIDEDEIEDPWNGWGGMPELDPEEIAAWNKTAEEIEAKWAELVEDAPYQEVATAEEWAKGTTDEKKRWAALLIKVTDGPPEDGVLPQRMVYAGYWSGAECDSDGLMDIQGAFKWYETPCSPSWTPSGLTKAATKAAMAPATETAVEAGGIVAGRRVGVARQAATGFAIPIAILRATRAHATLQPEVSWDAICILDAETVRQIDDAPSRRESSLKTRTCRRALPLWAGRADAPMQALDG